MKISPLSGCSRSLIKVLRVKAYTECTIRLMGVGEQRHPLGKSGERCYNSFLDHVIKSALNLFPVLDGDLTPGVLDGENVRVCPDGIGPGHVANGVKGVGKDSLQCHYVLDHGGGTRGRCFGQLHLESWFDWDNDFGEAVVEKGWLG